MSTHADLGQALATAVAAAPPIRVAVMDRNDGIAITGRITAALSDTHVRLLCDDGLVFAVPKVDLMLLPLEGGQHERCDQPATEAEPHGQAARSS